MAELVRGRLAPLGVLLLVLGASPAWGANAFVQAVTGTWAAGTTYTASITPSAGNLLCIGVFVQAGSAGDKFSSIADGTNTYTQIDTQSRGDGGTPNEVKTFYVKNVAGGATTITVNLVDATIGKAAIIVNEYSGADTTAPLDVHNITFQDNPGTGANAVSSPSVTTTTNGQVICGFSFSFQNGITYTQGTGFTARGTVANNGVSEDQIQTSAGSIAATFTVDISDANSHYYTAVATFKAAGAAATGCAGFYLGGGFFKSGCPN